MVDPDCPYISYLNMVNRGLECRASVRYSSADKKSEIELCTCEDYLSCSWQRLQKQINKESLQVARAIFVG